MPCERRFETERYHTCGGTVPYHARREKRELSRARRKYVPFRRAVRKRAEAVLEYATEPLQELRA